MPVGRKASYQAKRGEVQQAWFHVDASGQIVGRLATKVATVLMGKHRPTYTAHVDTGDFVVVTNAEKARFTGRKLDAITYDRYTYYTSGFRSVTAREMMKRHPERILMFAVRRMLPKNALGRKMLKKLKIYCGESHPHAAQQPEELTGVYRA